jgi:hypothetical protein
LGSAAQGLGFLHVDVVDEGNKSGYMKFLENCAILSIEEGYIEEEEIVEGLQKLFDQNWQWQLKGLGISDTWLGFLLTSRLLQL